MDNITKNTAKNTTMLYVLTIAKLVFPLLTLPYLTRTLTTDAYGVVAYVKSCMAYMQILIDFGFILSAVKDIVNANEDKKEIGLITGHVMVSKILLGLLVLAGSAIMAVTIPILKPYFWYTFLYGVSIFLTAFLADYLFRGIEKMHIVSIIFLVAKGTVTAFTFVFVRGDADILMIPILEIVGNLAAVIVSWVFIFKLKIPVRFKSFKQMFLKLRDSGIYFLSSVATTAFNALNTILIGIFLKDLTEVAYWSVAIQLLGAVQSLYTPINDGIYPQMIRHKSLKFIGKILLVFMPIVLAGCLVCFFCAKWILLIVGGTQYVDAARTFKYLIPVMFLSFPAMLFGWPTLGAIGKAKYVTLSTFCAAVVQVAGIFILLAVKQFNIPNIAILRAGTEVVLMGVRLFFIIRNRKEFNTGKVPLKAIIKKKGEILETGIPTGTETMEENVKALGQAEYNVLPENNFESEVKDLENLTTEGSKDGEE